MPAISNLPYGMIKSFIPAVIIFVINWKASGQQLKVSINNDPVENNAVYVFYPNFIDINISDKDANYRMIAAELLVYDKSGKAMKYKIRIDSSFIDCTVLRGYIQPEHKIILDIKRVQNIRTGSIVSLSKFFIIKFAGNLEFKEDPYFDVLINGSVLYKKHGIHPDSVKTITIVPENNNFNDILTITHARGARLVRNYQMNIAGLRTAGGQEIFKNGVTGDRFILTFSDRKSKSEYSIVIPVN